MPLSKEGAHACSVKLKEEVVEFAVKLVLRLVLCELDEPTEYCQAKTAAMSQ